MRFRRRSRRHQSNPEESSGSPDHAVPSSPFSNIFSQHFSFVTRFPIRRLNPFYIQDGVNRNVTPLYWQRSDGDDSHYQTHVPKCLGIGMSYSDILQGDRPDNYSSDCWLQGCLDRFGLVQTNSPEEGEEMLHNMDEDDDDSPVGSQVGSQSEIHSLVIEIEDNDSFDRFSGISDGMIDISGYTQILEPPPYFHPDEPPPTYEEAIGIAERRSNRSSVSGSSDIDFLW